jgi:hypothetical protein
VKSPRFGLAALFKNAKSLGGILGAVVKAMRYSGRSLIHDNLTVSVDPQALVGDGLHLHCLWVEAVGFGAPTPPPTQEAQWCLTLF